MKPIKNSEKGQILIFLVLVVIGLLGVTALALDGSMIYSDRRFTQSVADSASLAGGNAIKDYFAGMNITDAEIQECTDPKIKEAVVLAFKAAINRAREYYPEIGMPNSLNASDLVLTDAEYTLNPGAIDLGDHELSITCKSAGDSLIVNVALTSETQTAFVQVVSDAIARNTVRAETEVLTNRSLTGGYAIISLSQDCRNNEGGTWLSGTPLITLHEGGACSNSCMYTGGTSLRVESPDGPINYDPGDGWTSPGNPIVNPIPSPMDPGDDCIETDPFAEIFENLEALCNAMGSGVEVVDPVTGQRTFYQGAYTDLSQTNNKEPMDFKPGLYCLSHTGNKPALKILGGTVTANDVTFVIMDGDVNIGGNAGDTDPIVLKAPTDVDNDGVFDSGTTSPYSFSYCDNGDQKVPVVDSACPDGYNLVNGSYTIESVPPFLFYVTDWGRDPIFSLLGTSASAYDGIIFAPTSLVTIGGTSSAVTAEFGTSIIGYDVTISGGADVDVVALTEGLPSVSGWLDLIK
ncbi:MAG: Tad domain-containing protein [Bellilinea sp.]